MQPGKMLELEPTTIFTASLVFMWLVFLWDLYLGFRQYRMYIRTTERPAEVLEVMDKAEFDKSRLYKIDKARFGLCSAVYDQLESTAILWLELYAVFWYYTGSLGFEHNEVVHSILFTVLVNLVQTALALPWSVYDTFVIEQRHGFNKQTPGFFVKDLVKKTVVSNAISCPLIAVLVWIVRAGGPYFFLYIWIFVSLFIFVMMTVYPEFIAPLFDKYSPLPEGDLRSRIEALAAKLQYPLTKLLVVENSKRSAHSNAYLYGFWKNKRIVLFDTLLADYTPVQRDDRDKAEEDVKSAEHADDGAADKEKPRKLGTSNDEVVAILGHELGHWKLGHVTKNLFITELNLFVMFVAFQRLYTWQALYTAFGFADSQPVIIGLLLVFSVVFAPYNQLYHFLMILFTRHNEFQADEFSAELGYGGLLVSGLIKLSKDNLTFPVNDWLYSAVNHSHPPVVERIRAIRAVKPKAD